MAQTEQLPVASIQIVNVGGIDRSETECPPGITVLAGRNATNRTSFLQGLMAALGSDGASLKADAEEGSVELDIGGETYTRRLVRRNGTVAMDGNPYLDDSTLADLFAFLLESNEARRAVAGGRDLREVIMRPVDTDAIESQIYQLERRRDDLDAALEDLESSIQRLPELEEERTTLQREVEEKRDELEAKEAEIEAFDADLDETHEEKAELESKLDELRTVRGDLEDTRRRIGSERESVEALEEELDETRAALEELPAVPDDRVEEIGDEIQRLRGQRQSIETTIGDLRSIIQFNQESLDEGRPDIVAAIQGRDVEANDSITNQLVDGSEETVCWTCGTTVEKSQVHGMIDDLRDLHHEKTEARDALDERIDDLRDEREKLESRQQERDELDSKRGRIADEIDERRDRIHELEDRLDGLREEVGNLEDEVDVLETEDYSEVIDLHTEANQLDIELERLEEELGDVEDEIVRIEDELNERDAIESQREELGERLRDLRTRIQDLERAAVEEFNDHMDEVLDLLDYENLERVWIERTEREEREGRRTVSRGHFDLHIVRSTVDDAVYEDTVDHLSESEREVTGLIFALAGYLAHEVYEEVPFMVLDSVEALDSDRIASLVEYLRDFPDYLVVALLPEDAAALGDDVHRVTEI